MKNWIRKEEEAAAQITTFDRNKTMKKNIKNKKQEENGRIR